MRFALRTLALFGGIAALGGAQVAVTLLHGGQVPLAVSAWVGAGAALAAGCGFVAIFWALRASD